MRNITLIYDATLPSDQKVIEGVAAYVHEVGNWSVYIEEFALGKQRIPNVKNWHVDGILANLDDSKVGNDIFERKIPLVGFGGGYGWYRQGLKIPYFFADNKEIARMAAAHFLERGFRHFAYCGFPPTKVNGWSGERRKAFQEFIQEAGFTCSVFAGRHKTSKNWGALLESLCNWLAPLPKPLALMAANDKRARQVIEACKTLELRVPEQVAVLGVDDDEMLCQLATPTLTSVNNGARQIGYQAAALLDKLISGKSLSNYHYTVPPKGVIARTSTDVLAIEDREMAEVIRFVRDRAADGIKAQDVVEFAGVSRPTLESRFTAVLGHSIHTEIRNAQIKRAKDLIQSSDMQLKSIARLCGFKSIQYLTYFFRQATGQTPAQYRRSSRL